MVELRKILHVDDDEDIREIVKITLEIIGGFELLQCGSGLQAIEVAKSFSPQLFLLDVMMPNMGGEDTWKNLNALSGLEAVPVIFMTAKAEENNSNNLMSLGALAVILKPFDPAELCDTITDIWQQETP